MSEPLSDRNDSTRWPPSWWLLLMAATMAGLPVTLGSQYPHIPTGVLVALWVVCPLASLGTVAEAFGHDFAIRFKWFDLWMGAYIDHERGRLYICPLPCVVVTWGWK